MYAAALTSIAPVVAEICNEFPVLKQARLFLIFPEFADLVIRSYSTACLQLHDQVTFSLTGTRNVYEVLRIVYETTDLMVSSANKFWLSTSTNTDQYNFDSTESMQ